MGLQSFRIDPRVYRLFDKYKSQIRVIDLSDLGLSRYLEVLVPGNLIREYCSILDLKEKKVRAEGIWYLLGLESRLLELPKSRIVEGDVPKDKLQKFLDQKNFSVDWGYRDSDEDPRVLEIRVNL